MKPKQLGNLGEDIAADYLKKKGYEILDRNYVPKWITRARKEIDIIAEKPRRTPLFSWKGRGLRGENVLVFVEVKSAKELENFYPESKVDFQKKRKLIRIAESYILEKKIKPETKWQIDVIAVEFSKVSGEPRIRHFENAVSDV